MELSAKDLRIGDWVELETNSGWKLKTITADIIYELSQSDYECGNYRFIPLTEDWLIKFDLQSREVLTGKTPYTEYSIRNEFDIYCYMDESGNCLFWGLIYYGEDFFIIKCDTVHKFQEIYELFTQEKLEIKEYA